MLEHTAWLTGTLWLLSLEVKMSLVALRAKGTVLKGDGTMQLCAGSCWLKCMHRQLLLWKAMLRAPASDAPWCCSPI